MEKKLPGIFVNRKQKSTGNNERVFYSNKEEDRVINEPQKIVQNINQKINNIFTSSNYIYKANTKITLKDKIINKVIVGKNSTHLITYDNELIPISDIVDIERK